MSKRTDRAILIYPLINVCVSKISKCFRFMSVSLTENILINPTLLLIININFQNSLWSQGYLQKGFIKYGHNLIIYPQMRQVTSVLLSSSTAHHVSLSYLSLFILGLQNFLDLICLKNKQKTIYLQFTWDPITEINFTILWSLQNNAFFCLSSQVLYQEFTWQA